MLRFSEEDVIKLANGVLDCPIECQYNNNGSDCFYCPGTTANGRNCHAAYESVRDTDSSRKMLIWLRKTVKYLESKQSKETSCIKLNPVNTILVTLVTQN